MTRDPLAALRRHGDQLRERWADTIAELQAAGRPAHMEWIGGGLHVIAFRTEDPADYVWLGVVDDVGIDGPWLQDYTDEQITGVAGYRYAGEHVSELVYAARRPDEPLIDTIVRAYIEARDAATPHQQ